MYGFGDSGPSGSSLPNKNRKCFVDLYSKYTFSWISRQIQLILLLNRSQTQVNRDCMILRAKSWCESIVFVPRKARANTMLRGPAVGESVSLVVPWKVTMTMISQAHFLLHLALHPFRSISQTRRHNILSPSQNIWEQNHLTILASRLLPPNNPCRTSLTSYCSNTTQSLFIHLWICLWIHRKCLK